MKIGQIALPGFVAELPQRPIERPLRLATGLTLFAFVICHFVSHTFGVLSIAAMQRASELLLGPWQTLLGLCLLYGALLTHALLGVRAFYRRRHLRIPAGEAWQLGLAVLIPLLLIPHAGALRIGQSAYDIASGHEQLLYQFFVQSPDFALPRQMLLLLVAWLHACIGIRAWLRYRPWYRRATPALASLATLLPVVALLGALSAGLDLREAVERNPSYAARFVAPPAQSTAGRNAAALDNTVYILVALYLGLIAIVLALRAARDWYAARFQAIRINYPGNRAVTVAAGYSVLETSRWADIPHASVCGGRGRCSTCRVRIVAGAETLSPPSPLERATLAGIGAPEGVRLACQIRPSSDLAVEPLVPIARATDANAFRFEAAAQGGRELKIAAMFVDLRESSRLASGRLPYDALFLFDRYIQVVTAAIHGNAGHVTSVASDGIMSIFGAQGPPQVVAHNAFKAALMLWEGIDDLNNELAQELKQPLRIGIGLHVGLAVVGWIHGVEASSLQFLGDTGNVAAKLEAHTKQLNCTLIASLEAVDMLSPALSGVINHGIAFIPGKDEEVPIASFALKAELQKMVVAASP